MPLIITATDFSDAANYALEYSCMLANAVKADVVVLHSYTVPVSIGDNPMPMMSVEECRQIAEKAMMQLTDKLTVTFNDVRVTGLVMFGEITEVIQDYAAQNKPWLIVIGNSISNEESVWYGGNLMSILRSMAHPVLAVPEGCLYSPVSKICYACDYKKETEGLPLTAIADMATQMGSQLHVLNIDHDNANFNAETPEISEVLHEKLKSANPQYHYADAKDTDTAILDFVNTNHINWLVVAPHKHGFIESLFRKSHTKELAKHLQIPLLSVH
jgi:nucleotide-binding universal stress UspA family protein